MRLIVTCQQMCALGVEVLLDFTPYMPLSARQKFYVQSLFWTPL